MEQDFVDAASILPLKSAPAQSHFHILQSHSKTKHSNSHRVTPCSAGKAMGRESPVP